MKITAITKEFQKARAIKGFSLQLLADKTKSTPTNLSFIENGKKHPRPSTAKKICTALETEFENIFTIE